MEKKNKIEELENVLLDQIEKLNDDSLMSDPEQARIVVDKSRAISELSKNYSDIQRLKLEVVRTAMKDMSYAGYLGLDCD